MFAKSKFMSRFSKSSK